MLTKQAMEAACLGRDVPPAEGEGPAVDVGATVHLAEPPVVGGNVLQEAAPQAQWLQEAAHVVLQAAFTSHQRAKGLGDAKLLGQDEHGDLWGDRGLQGHPAASLVNHRIIQRIVIVVGDPPPLGSSQIGSSSLLPPPGNPVLFPPFLYLNHDVSPL